MELELIDDSPLAMRIAVELNHQGDEGQQWKRATEHVYLYTVHL